MNNTPFLVSVIIPVYNAEKYIEEAINSVLMQAETGEVITVDDGSNDNSYNILLTLAKENNRVRVLHHPNFQNKGISATKNLGIKNAKFDYIAFLDADDIYLENRFSCAKKILLNNPLADGVYEAIGNLYDESQKLISFTQSVEPENVFENMVPIGHLGYFSGNGLTIKKEVVNKAGFFDERLKTAEDTLMWFKMAFLSKLYPGQLNKPVALYRKHENNTTKNRMQFLKYQSEFYLLLYDWLIEKKGPEKKRFLVINAFLNFQFFKLSYEIGKSSFVFYRLKTLLLLVVRFPEFIYKKITYYYLFKILSKKL